MSLGLLRCIRCSSCVLHGLKVLTLVQLASPQEADMQKVGILYPLRESGMGGCVGKGSGTEEMRTLEKKNLKWEF